MSLASWLYDHFPWYTTDSLGITKPPVSATPTAPESGSTTTPTASPSLIDQVQEWATIGNEAVKIKSALPYVAAGLGLLIGLYIWRKK